MPISPVTHTPLWIFSISIQTECLFFSPPLYFSLFPGRVARRSCGPVVICWWHRKLLDVLANYAFSFICCLLFCGFLLLYLSLLSTQGEAGGRPPTLSLVLPFLSFVLLHRVCSRGILGLLLALKCHCTSAWSYTLDNKTAPTWFRANNAHCSAEGDAGILLQEIQQLREQCCCCCYY